MERWILIGWTGLLALVMAGYFASRMQDDPGDTGTPLRSAANTPAPHWTGIEGGGLVAGLAPGKASPVEPPWAPPAPIRPAVDFSAFEPETIDTEMYAPCEGLHADLLSRCYRRQDERLSTLRISCRAYAREPERLQACVELAERLEPYSG
jgi:hypothetical protein